MISYLSFCHNWTPWVSVYPVFRVQFTARTTPLNEGDSYYSFNAWRFRAPVPDSWSVDEQSEKAFTTLDGTIINTPIDSVSGEWILNFINVPVAEPSNKLLPTGHSFKLTVEQAVSKPASINNSIGDFTITIPYKDSDIEGIDEMSLNLYYWDQNTENWSQLNTILDLERNIAATSTNTFGLFALLGESANDAIYLPIILK